MIYLLESIIGEYIKDRAGVAEVGVEICILIEFIVFIEFIKFAKIYWIYNSRMN